MSKSVALELDDNDVSLNVNAAVNENSSTNKQSERNEGDISPQNGK